MKKFILLSILALTLIGCGETVNHPIADHVFVNYTNSSREYASAAYAFSGSGSCKILIYTQTPPTTFEHFKWKPEGNTIVIRHDNSFYWKAEVRGTIEDELIYDPKENSLTSTYTKDVYYKFSL